MAVTGYWVDLGGSKWRCKSFKTQAGSIEKAHVELYSKKQVTVERQPKFIGMYLGMYSNNNDCKA